MKVNTGKSYLLLSDNSRATATIDNSYIESEDEQVLLGATIDSDLTFEGHINNICKTASQKLNALARITPYMNIQKRRTIIKSFVTSQFSYCLLTWRLNNKINSVHERALRIIYQENTSTFQELLNKDNSVSIHYRNLQVLATEIFKIHRGFSPELLRETFVSSSYNLRRNDTFEKTSSALCISRYWVVIVFKPKNMGFSTSGIETIEESWLLQIKNKELRTLWMSMQIMLNLHTRSTISLKQYDHLRSLLLLLSFLSFTLFLLFLVVI